MLATKTAKFLFGTVIVLSVLFWIIDILLIYQFKNEIMNDVFVAGEFIHKVSEDPDFLFIVGKADLMDERIIELSEMWAIATYGDDYVDSSICYNTGVGLTYDKCKSFAFATEDEFTESIIFSSAVVRDGDIKGVEITIEKYFIPRSLQLILGGNAIDKWEFNVGGRTVKMPVLNISDTRRFRLVF